MTEASFYILPTLSQSERFLFTCKLIEKAYRNRQFCYVYTESEQQNQQLDEQLWNFRPGSFIPHQILQTDTPDYEKTILIGNQPAPKNWQKTIINLSSNYLEDLTQTDRLLEILDASEEIKQAGRVRYRHYKQAGLTITTHTIKNQ